ncbi:MAG: 3-isopropylmalate dehydratase large subunit, partial [Cyclobacteriaceae bacterium]|nr:3-isopropylmalate dehydratase large subunit [Cyclobacteriaceae bacterium]
MKPKTIFEKIWDAHVVKHADGYPDALFIDRHFIHEVTSPQAFDGLRKRGINVFNTRRTTATADHNVPTKDQHLPIKEALSRHQVETLRKNCKEFGVELYDLGHPYQGIVHIIGPELGLTLPGMTIVCGDSHTSTHGAFGNIAFGIGTSEVEQVLATQCILQYKPKTMKIEITGTIGKGVVSKDIILYIISKISASGATGFFVEYAGDAIRSLSMEARMTICNMSIEMGARGGLIAPDETTFNYIQGRKFAPQGEAFDKAITEWKALVTDVGATYDQVLSFDGADITPMITYGTNPGMGMKVTDRIPTEDELKEISEQTSFKKSLEYMGLEQGAQLLGKSIDYVFIGSCTNARIEDLRAVASMVKGKKKAASVEVWVVPGSKQVQEQAKKEGLDKIFEAAGFELRDPGCSACLGMNEDKIPA